MKDGAICRGRDTCPSSIPLDFTFVIVVVIPVLNNAFSKLTPQRSFRPNDKNQIRTEWFQALIE